MSMRGDVLVGRCAEGVSAASPAEVIGMSLVLDEEAVFQRSVEADVHAADRIALTTHGRFGMGVHAAMLPRAGNGAHGRVGTWIQVRSTLA